MKVQVRKHGQVMVLGCVTMLLLALSLMMSFSVANAVHERIRLQSHADAVAFSMAVVEARTMNYLAYSNRAIAAAFVSMTTVHVYGAILSSSVELMKGMRMAATVALALETVLWISSLFTQHSGHMRRLMETIAGYNEDINKYRNLIRTQENLFNNSVEGFVQLASEIHKSQRDMVVATSSMIQNGNGNALDFMRQNNAPCATHAFAQVGSLNLGEFACAMEGSPLDAVALAHKKPENENEFDGRCPFPSEAPNRRRVMSNVVNASRPPFLDSSHGLFVQFGPLAALTDWLTGGVLSRLEEVGAMNWMLEQLLKGTSNVLNESGQLSEKHAKEISDLLKELGNTAGNAAQVAGAARQVTDVVNDVINNYNNMLSLGTGPNNIFNQDIFLNRLLKDIPNPLFILGMPSYQLKAHLSDQYCEEASSNSQGRMSCAKTSGTFFSYVYKDMPGFGWAQAAGIASSQNSSKHEADGEMHTETHNRYKGLLNNSPCTNGGNCFINFRLGSEANNWGQPAVYAKMTQRLEAWTQSDGSCSQTRQAWELNEAGTVRIQHGERGEGRLLLKANRDGMAVSKALVYFHRMDHWKFPPNLFDPYWRAKLHPFANDKELQKVSGNSNN